jgi:arginyl-tRNA synthetase
VKEHLEELLAQSLLHLQRDGLLPPGCESSVQLERSRSPEHGEFASNVAMVLAKPAGRPPRELAQAIIDRMPRSRQVERLEIAGPGFINFFLHRFALTGVIRDALRQGDEYGNLLQGARNRVTVEFVSANPTGPLHVGHGRGAAFGASVASILATAGFDVQREYYVNDNGRQMDILAVSVWLRYLELCGESIGFPENGYRGDYIYDIARIVRVEHGDRWRHTRTEVEDGLPPSLSAGGDGERFLDALIQRAYELLGEDGYRIFFDAALNTILADIKQDLAEFRVYFDLWFSERELEESGAVQHAIDRLRENGHLYVKDGATWFRASALGDEKDRVVIRENGQTTTVTSRGCAPRRKASVRIRTGSRSRWSNSRSCSASGKRCRCRRAPGNSSRCANCGRRSAPMPPVSFTSCGRMTSTSILISTWPSPVRVTTRFTTSSTPTRASAAYSATWSRWTNAITRPSGSRR